MPEESNQASQTNRGVLLTLVLSTQVVGITVLVLIGVWIQDYLGGFEWSGNTKFNYHPFFMVLSMMYIYGTSAVVYRVFPNAQKIYVKILHATLNGLVIIGIIVGLAAVIEFHNDNKFPNLYSLHSWCGVFTVSVFVLQYIFGFATFLFPGLSEDTKARALPFHRYFGNAILLLIGATIISGLTEKLLFNFKKTYPTLPPVGLIANFCGIFVIVFILLVLFILNKPEWMRKKTEESAHLLGPMQ